MTRCVLLGDQSPEKHGWKKKASQVFILHVPLPRTLYWPPPPPWTDQDQVWTSLPGDSHQLSVWSPASALQRTLLHQWRKWIPRGELAGYSLSQPFPQLGFPICVVLKPSFLSEKTIALWGQEKCQGSRNTANWGSGRSECRVVIRNVERG